MPGGTTSSFSIENGVLGLLTMDQTAFITPSLVDVVKYKKTAAYFKMYLGLDHENELGHSGGDLPDVHMYGYYGERIGGAADPKRGKKVAGGSSAVFRAKGEGEWKKKPFQPVYTLFTANDDAICVSITTATFPGLSGNYAWLGDWGSHCACDNTTMATWYYGGVAVPGTSYVPNCLWIDKDGGQPATAFQVNWLDLKPSEADTRIGKAPDSMCQTPTFNIFQSHDPTSIIYGGPAETDDHGVPIEDPKNVTRTRRSVAAAKLRFEQKWGDILVVDDLSSHTAHTLCESSTSAGPSFVNVEDGYFCDMQTKTVYPVCEEEKKEQQKVCFDTEQNELVGPGLQKRSIPFRVQDWRLNREAPVDASTFPET